MIASLRQRAVVAAGVLALLVVAALALFGLPGDDSTSSPRFTALAEAAEHTASYPGARMTVEGAFEAPDAGTLFTMEGEGVYNSAGRSQLTMRATDLTPELAATMPGGFELEQIMEIGSGRFATYMRSDSFGELPDGAEWVMVDMSEDMPDSMSMDPRATLRQLRSASEQEELGREVIRGNETTHYRAIIDQSAEVERLREEGDDDAADALELAIDLAGSDTMELEVWVDSRKTIHRFAFEMPFELGLPGGVMQMTADLSDFGIDPEIELPSEDETFDATELSQESAEAIAESD